MRPRKSPPAQDADKEISALIETLHETGQRLEELTSGEVDAVAGRDGRTFLLRHAQEQLRHSETAKQAAILNALPAHIALLDTQGDIISVNGAWKRFADANALQSPEYAIGVNYLDVCDSAQGDGAADAQQAAAGIRSVLSGGEKSFSIEYACHSPAEERWFLMTVTPLADDRPHGAVVMHLNITERKQVEDRLRESKTLLQLVVENVPLRIFWKDRDFRYLGCNTRFAKDAGHSRPDELTGKTDFEMARKDQAELYRDDDKAVLESGAPRLDIEEPQTTPEGNTIWLRTSKVPLRGMDNQIIGILGLYQDITERKQAESSLRESERRFSDLLGNVELISMMLDREARITYCNDYLLRLTGWRREEVIEQNWFDFFVPPENDELNGSFFAALLANLPEAWHHENEILTRSGERRLIRWSNSVLRSGAGDVIGTASIGEDITEQRRHQEASRQNEERTRSILESAGEGIHGIDMEGRIIFENPAAANLLGYGIGALSGTHAHAAMHYSRKDGTPYPIEQCPVHLTMRDGVARRVEDEVFWRKDGSSFPVEYTTAPMRNGRDDITGVVVAFQDITDRKEAENRIKRLNRVYAVLGAINTLIVRSRDRQDLFDEACRITVEQGGFRLAWVGLLDANAVDVTPVARAGVDEGYLDNIRLTARENVPDSCTLVARALQEKTAVVCNDIDADPQMARWREEALRRGFRSVVVFPLQFADKVSGVLSLYAAEKDFFDTEEMKLLTELAGDVSFAVDHIEKQARLDYLAHSAVLPGLANRNLFLERVAQYIHSAASGGHKLALFLTDLERFKNINDSLGRQAGDALLRQVAEWLTRIAGDANLVARVGADVFAVVLPEVRQGGDLARMLKKMIEAFLAHPFRLNDAIFRIAAKGGVALFPDDGADAETLFRNAEAALKKAKASGERYLFYAQTMTEAVAGKLTLENQLREALDNEEFVLHYQAKVNLASGKLTGAEALIRWNDPRTGLVPPGRFIPILEQTGLIYDVGRWALKRAIADYLRWRAAGLAPVRIAVNVSALQLRNRGFIDEIKQVIGIDARAPAGLELEITEGLIMEDVKGTIASLGAIRDMGVSIAIDDFGTGFSSLAYLAKLPVDTLKIDRSFVIDMTVGPQGLALVSTIIKLAHSLKLKVVAEGVETEEQSRLLRLLACDEMQGFLFSKPVPVEIFETKFLAPPGATPPALIGA